MLSWIPAQLYGLIFKISLLLSNFLESPLTPCVFLHISFTLAIACVICYTTKKKGAHLSRPVGYLCFSQYLALCWQVIRVCCYWRVWEWPCRRSWRQHRLKLLFLTCSAHLTCVKRCVSCCLSGGLTTFKEWEHEAIYVKDYNVLGGAYLKVNDEANTSNKTHMELIIWWTVRLYHTVSLFTGDKCTPSVIHHSTDFGTSIQFSCSVMSNFLQPNGL